MEICGSWRFANEYSFDRIFREANIFSNTLSSILAKIFEFRISSILLQNLILNVQQIFREFSLPFFESPLMKEDFYSNGWSFLLKTFFVLSFFFSNKRDLRMYLCIIVSIACIWNFVREFILEICQIRVWLCSGKIWIFFLLLLCIYAWLNFCTVEEDKERGWKSRASWFWDA